MKTTARAASIQEIGEATGITKRSAERRATAGKWRYTEESCAGGKRRLYDLHSLPKDVRDAVIGLRLAALQAEPADGVVSAFPIVPLAKPPASHHFNAAVGNTAGHARALPITASVRPLDDRSRAIGAARAAFVAEVRRAAVDIGVTSAIAEVALLASTGELPPALSALVPVANARARDDRGISRSALFAWCGKVRGIDSPIERARLLVPESTNHTRIPPWAPHLLKLYQQPQKPSLLTAVHSLPRLLPPGITAPSYDAAYRFLRKMGNVELQRGRVLPRELAKMRTFVRRDSSTLEPCSVFTADGHTFDAEVAHPLHGRPFRPEITGVIDVATRKLVGFSIGLAESTWTVLDAWRNAVERAGVNSIFYVDRGAGFRNQAMADEEIGFAARIGSTLTHSLPYNSQARGVIERSHRSIWVKLAKSFPTYLGAPMDPEAKQKVFKLTRRDIRDSGTSRLLMRWPDFMARCEAAVAEYNAHPHTGLPKFDAADGTHRHMSPDEAWTAAEARGWVAHKLSADDLQDLFRPNAIRVVRRGEIELFGNRYFSADLEEFDHDRVRVGYDIHDASRVWVRDLEGRLITVAEFEANKRAYFPQPFIDRANEKRAEGRARRLQVKQQEVADELNPPALIEHQPATLVPFAIEAPEPAPVRAPELVTLDNGRPRFNDNLEMLEWLAEHYGDITQRDVAWIAKSCAQSREFERLAGELFGDWRSIEASKNEDDDNATFKVATR